MIITALLFLCCTSISADTPLIPETSPATELKSLAPAAGAKAIENTKPDAPTPKFASSSRAEGGLGSGLESSSSAIEPGLSTPVKPAIPESYGTARQRKIWYGLMATSHGAAVLDAWTTRRALSGGYGTEANPLQRPFAHSSAIYASTQVVPLMADYAGRRMMRSRHPWMRRVWWVPQAASASVSLRAGIHNYGVAH
ncbi:MAG: hypothetical protein WBL63_20370 [Candidatus Acidiferrum sp.]